MVKTVKTETGFSCKIDTNRLDDMELMEKIAEVDGGNPLAITVVINKILGEEAKKKLYDHVRLKDGRVPIEAISEELSQIIIKVSEMGEQEKNS